VKSTGSARRKGLKAEFKGLPRIQHAAPPGGSPGALAIGVYALSCSLSMRLIAGGVSSNSNTTFRTAAAALLAQGKAASM
jgi:hypothetical protein